MTMKQKTTLSVHLADVCLPDYWPGCDLPHVSFPVHRHMKAPEAREALQEELRKGDASPEADSPDRPSEEWFEAAQEAVKEAHEAHFTGLGNLIPDAQGEEETIYAYYVFREED